MSLLRHHQLLMRSSSQPSGSWNPTVANLPGLWGWWKLDELAGAATAADSSGNGRDGAYTGAGVRATPGIFSGSAAYRSPLGGRVILPPLPLSSSPQFSIVAWIIPNSSTSFQSIVSADGSPRRVWQFRRSSGHLQFVTLTTTGGSAHTMFTGPDPLLFPGTPAMVAATYDHDGPVKKAMYVNGEQEAISPVGAIYTASSEAAPMAIGARNNGANQELWGGGMDEVIVTTSVLSPAQIAALWNARND